MNPPTAIVLIAFAIASSPVLAATLGGKLSYPGEEIPPLVIVAYNLTTHARIVTETPARARRYRIEVPAGRYHVYALASDAGPVPLRGAYSSYTVCGQRSPRQMQDGRCTEHRVIEVVVQETGQRSDIDLDDWYLPDDELHKLPAPRER